MQLYGIAVTVMASMVVGKSEYTQIAGNDEYYLFVACIVIGAIAAVVSFFGFCGACAENVCLLYTVSLMMSVNLKWLCLLSNVHSNNVNFFR